MPLRVAVVGLGTAGAAAATLLGRMGHRVDVLEHVVRPGAIGAGIGLQPIGQTVLARLGLFNEVMEKSGRVDRLYGETESGRVVLDLSYSAVDPRLCGYGVHRGVLFTALADAASAEPNVTVRTGVEVSAVRSRGPGGGSDLLLAGAAEGDAVAGRGQVSEEGPFDLVVVADGARSSLRDGGSLPLRAFVKEYPFGCLWVTVPDKDGEFSDRTLTQVYARGAKDMLGVLPIGRAVGSEGDSNQVTIFWSIPNKEVPAFRRDGQPAVEAWRNRVSSLMPRLGPLVKAGVKENSDLVHATYVDVAMPRLATDRVVLLGDAAHATSPQLGQGANLALVDAWELARAIGEAEEDGASKERVVADALSLYEQRRRARLWFHQFNSRILTPVFQSNSAVIGGLRNLFMGPLCHFPPTRHHMAGTMAGVKHPNVFKNFGMVAEEEYTAQL